MRIVKAGLGSLCLAAVVAAVVAGGAALAASDASIVIKRQGFMKGNADHAKAIVAFIKKGEGTGMDVAKRAGAVSELAKLIPAFFPEGTGMDEIKEPGSGAKPEIRLDWDTAEAAGPPARRLRIECLVRAARKSRSCRQSSAHE